MIVFRREGMNSVFLMCCSICKKSESLTLASSGQQCLALFWREILATETLALQGMRQLGESSKLFFRVRMCGFAKEEVPVVLGATVDGTNASLVYFIIRCSGPLKMSKLTCVWGEQGYSITRLALWLLFPLNAQICSFFC